MKLHPQELHSYNTSTRNVQTQWKLTVLLRQRSPLYDYSQCDEFLQDHQVDKEHGEDDEERDVEDGIFNQCS